MSKTLFPIPKDLLNSLRSANSEATVRQLVVQQLECGDIKLEEGNTDVYHKNILIEFKHDEDMQHKEGDRAKILAQALYYCNAYYVDGRIEQDGTGRVPPYVVLIDKDEFVFYERETLEAIYKQTEIFLNSSASSPDEAVIKKCKNVVPLQYIFLRSPEDLDKAVRQLRSIVHRNIMVVEDITEFNFVSVYSSWSNAFQRYLDTKANENRPHIFRLDILNEGIIVQIKPDNMLDSEVIEIHFNLNSEIMKIERCPKEEYENFWSNWNRVTDKRIIDIVFQKAYDLFDVASRRHKGQFYTPPELAKYGWKYIENVLGKNFWLDGTWRIWDCSCGDGGLALVIPRSAQQYTYLSSLDAGEIDIVKSKHPMCKKVWQMDFLRTETPAFPDEVKNDMENPDIKWLFFINPPYGEGSSGKATSDATWHKKGGHLTYVREQMLRHNLGIEAREKYAQFLFRIEKEFKKKYVMGCYTTMKAFVSKDFVNLRKFWKPEFKGGLICCAHQWHQSANKGEWPSAFSVFDCRERGKWGTMPYDVLEYQKGNANGIFKGQKEFTQEDAKRSFRKYFFPNEGLPKNELTVVQSNGLKPFSGKSKMTNWRPKGTWASAGLISAYMRTRDQSRGMVSGNVIDNLVPIFINERNYKRVLCGLGLYWSVTHTWINHEDCFLAPSRDLTPQEQSDAVLFSLVCTRNRTTTARLEEAIITTNKGRVVNGGIIVENKLNPFDKKMFVWDSCSEVGLKVLQLYKHYLDNVVKWKEQDTVIGKGEWLGLYQYHRIVPLPKELVAAIEKLREQVEKTAIVLCLS